MLTEVVAVAGQNVVECVELHLLILFTAVEAIEIGSTVDAEQDSFPIQDE